MLLAVQPLFQRDPLRASALDLELLRITRVWVYRLYLAVLKLHHPRDIRNTGMLLESMQVSGGKTLGGCIGR